MPPINFSAEIDRVERGAKYTEVHNDKKVKLQEKVLIPVKEHPKVCSMYTAVFYI